MKTILVTILFLSLASITFSQPKPKQEFRILSTKKHILHYKVDKSFVGGIVEVYNANKVCLASNEVPHTYNVIYFDETPSGRYNIKVTKGNKVIEFPYENIR